MSRRHPRRPAPKALEEIGRPLAYTSRNAVPRRAQIDRRRAKAIDLKVQGFPLRIIGAKLHADPEANESGASFEGGYGWRKWIEGEPPLSGNPLELTVSRDISAALRSARIASEAVRAEALTLTLMQLEMGAAAIYQRVLAGEPRAQEVWLRNIEMQIKLQGLDQGDKLHITVGGTIGLQPEFNSEYATKMFDALQSVGVIPAGVDALNALVPALTAAPTEAVEATATEST